MDLFEHAAENEPSLTPLSERMRPQLLDEVVGQTRWLAKDSFLRAAVRSNQLPSLILWGPPGSGKTTLAHVLARQSHHRFVALSAVESGVAEIKKVIQKAQEERRAFQRKTIFFIDEIHRFNRAQQDALLPHVEKGIVILIGATTENPSFAVNAALLSRARVLRLETLSPDDLATLVMRALEDSKRGLGQHQLTLTDTAKELLVNSSDGDARRALNVLELSAQITLSQNGARQIAEATVEEALASRTLVHDKHGEGHYNVVSAFIKSMRGSDADAALYWMFRMLEAGEDPLYVLRRMLIFASEDIGNADPQALSVAVAADQAFQRLGYPEGLHTLAHCCTYLSTAPKSNATYVAWTAAQKDAQTFGSLEVPFHLRNAATPYTKKEGYGKNYHYPHDAKDEIVSQTYLPPELLKRSYYQPKNSGFEQTLRERIQFLEKAKNKG